LPNGADDAGDRISHHRGQILKDALNLRQHEPFVLGLDVETFDGVADAGGIYLAEGFE
jgi:hypothetical protein